MEVMLRTSKIVEVGILVVLVKDRLRPEFDLVRCEYCYTIPWQLLCESSAPMMIFESRDTGCDCR